MNPSGLRPPPYALVSTRPSTARAPGSRILGDQRRETAEAAAAAARANRRRLARLDEDDDEYTGDAFANDSLFADSVYEDEDREADEIYASVDRRMESSRQAQREARIEAELERYREENPPTIEQQFADSKSALSKVSYDEWAGVPDIGDYSVKKRKLEKYTPAPDSLLEKAQQETAVAGTVQGGTSGAATDLAAIGAGRASVLGHKLDRAGAATGGRAPVDATGYLTEMAGMHISSASEVSDIKKARLLLGSVTSTNPRHAPGWIAAARLEEVAGKMSAARALAEEGCRRCPREEDVWLEAARLHAHAPDRARRVLAQAVVHVPRAVKVWLAAAALEDVPRRRRGVLRKALEVVPRSARLWRAAVELEDARGARILLERAVECVPDDVDLWLALAKLEPYERAKEVLNRARNALPTEPALWVTAARLEEQSRGKDSALIPELLRNAVASLSVQSGIVKRERWLQEAREADKAKFPATCAAIVEAALSLGIEEVDWLDVWSEDTNAAEQQGFSLVARAIHAKLTSTFPAHQDAWLRSAEFEKRAGDSERMQKVLASALDYCARVEVLWLMLAKEQWLGGDVSAARITLSRGLKANLDSEAIWIAAAKVETQSGEYKRARELLERARNEAASARVFMKSALLERLIGNDEAELAFLDQGVHDYQEAHKLWLMLAQWHERNKKPLVERSFDEFGCANGTEVQNGCIASVYRDARAVYQKSVTVCPHCVHLWIGMARLEESGGARAPARAVLERARQANKGRDDVDLLWRESVYLEVRLSGGQVSRTGASAPGGDAAQTLLARGLQECGSSGKLWALAMALAPAAERKARTGDGLRECGRDAVVVLEAGRLLWQDGKSEKARKWLARSVELDGDCGDAWGTLLAFEKEHGDADSVRSVEERAQRAEPCHGDVWCAVRKAAGNERWSLLEALREVARLSSGESCVTGHFYPRAG